MKNRIATFASIAVVQRNDERRQNCTEERLLGLDLGWEEALSGICGLPGLYGLWLAANPGCCPAGWFSS